MLVDSDSDAAVLADSLCAMLVDSDSDAAVLSDSL